MSKLTHFEKDADVDRLKFEQWWATDDKSAPNPKEYAWQAWQAAINSQSLSQEAVRDEVLEEAAKVCDAESYNGLPNNMIRVNSSKELATAIRALKREPNAGRQEQPAMRQETGAHLPDGSAPKVCPCCHQALAYHIPSEPNAAGEPCTAWFVENDDSQWWMGGARPFATDEGHWTRDPHKAKAYKSKESAQETCDYLFPEADCKVTGHIFLPEQSVEPTLMELAEEIELLVFQCAEQIRADQPYKLDPTTRIRKLATDIAALRRGLGTPCSPPPKPKGGRRDY